MLETIKVDPDGAYAIINGQNLWRITDDSESPTGEQGSRKMVFVGGEYVVKFVDDERPELTPEFEVFFELEDRKHFAQVVYVDLDARWYVQERVNCVPNAPITKEQTDFVYKLGEKYNVVDLSSNLDAGRGEDERDPWKYSFRSHNWTVDIHGTPIIFDLT